jgi:hypothetical protein
MEDVSAYDAVRRQAEDDDERDADKSARAHGGHAEHDAEPQADRRRDRFDAPPNRHAVLLAWHAE